MRPGSTGSSGCGVPIWSAADGNEATMSSRGACAAGATSLDGASPSPVSTVMIGVPTSTVVPSPTSSSVTTPANGEGSSTIDFAVSISTTISLTFTVSPGLTFHDTISASVRPSPTSGSLNCFIWRTPGGGSEREGSVDGVEHAVQVGEVLLLDPARRVGGVEAADPQHRRLQRVEALLGDPGCHLG